MFICARKLKYSREKNLRDFAFPWWKGTFLHKITNCLFFHQFEYLDTKWGNFSNFQTLWIYDVMTTWQNPLIESVLFISFEIFIGTLEKKTWIVTPVWSKLPFRFFTADATIFLPGNKTVKYLHRFQLYQDLQPAHPHFCSLRKSRVRHTELRMRSSRALPSKYKGN